MADGTDGRIDPLSLLRILSRRTKGAFFPDRGVEDPLNVELDVVFGFVVGMKPEDGLGTQLPEGEKGRDDALVEVSRLVLRDKGS